MEVAMEAEMCGDSSRRRDDIINRLQYQLGVWYNSLVPSYDCATMNSSPEMGMYLCHRVDDVVNHFQSEDEVRRAVNDGRSIEIISILFDVIEKVSRDERFFQRQKESIRELTIIAVKLAGHGSLATWQLLITKLVTTANTVETTRENCIEILKLISDWMHGDSLEKTVELKRSVNSWFQHIHVLFLSVLKSERMELIRATLPAILSFLRWIPLDYKLDSQLADLLLQLFPQSPCCNLALQCLTMVSAKNMGDPYHLQYVILHKGLMGRLSMVLPIGKSIQDAFACGSDEDKEIILNLVYFLTSFYKNHIQVLESTQENIALLTVGLKHLLDISRVDDIKVYGVCIDYWTSLVLKLCETYRFVKIDGADANTIRQLNSMNPDMIGDHLTTPLQRKKFYVELVSEIRKLMTDCMMKHGCQLAIGGTLQENVYMIMRETTNYLYQFDFFDTRKQKPFTQPNGEDWTFKNFDILRGDKENIFPVLVIDDLLTIGGKTEGANIVDIAEKIMCIATNLGLPTEVKMRLINTITRKLAELTSGKVQAESEASPLEDYFHVFGKNKDNAEETLARETSAQEDESNSVLSVKQENDKLTEKGNPGVSSSSLSVKEYNTNDGSNKRDRLD